MANQNRILVVEDEDSIRDFVVINLKRAGYTVVAVASGEEALEVFDRENQTFNIALLDIMLPGIDGFAVCKELRQRSGTLGIIMLTAKSQEMDKVSGLMIGADDYVTKPFSPSELVARIDAINRRVNIGNSGDGKTDVLVSDPFVLDRRSRTLFKNKAEIFLTQVEFQIMEYLMGNPGIALEREKILKKVWKDSSSDIKIVDVNIRRLRMKIEDEPSEPKYLLTIWGYGYKWNH